MVAMLQIPRVFPCVFCLGSAKAVQYPRPWPKFGDKSQQIPRYSRVCPRGQPLGWSLLSVLSSSVALQTWATLESRTKQPGWNKSVSVSDRSSVKKKITADLDNIFNDRNHYYSWENMTGLNLVPRAFSLAWVKALGARLDSAEKTFE